MKFLFITGFISSGIIRAVCWTLLHSLWQGLAAAAIAGVIVLGTRRSKAVLRYNLLSMVFAAFVLGSLITFLCQPGIVHLPVDGIAGPELLPVSIADLTPGDTGGQWMPSLQPGTFFQPLIYYANKYSTVITGCWAGFFFINFGRMLSGLRYAYRLRYRQTNGVTQDWKERLHTLSSLLGIHSRVLLKESGLIKVPVVIGFLKPVILVPLGMFAHLSVEQVETIFVHELAHIRRKDFAVNLLQRFAESVFFFNPFIVWMSSLIREEREACCDDIVLEYTADKRAYLEALVSFRETGFARHRYTIALGGNSLLNRAKRILTNENKKLNVMEKITLIIVVLAMTAFGFIPEKKEGPVKFYTGKHQVTGSSLASNKQSNLPPVAVAGTAGNPVAAADTVPGKSITFRNISTSNNDDGVDRVREVKALGSDGKKYNYKMVNDDIKEFSINGTPVGRENFGEYEWLIKKIEISWTQNTGVALLKQKNSLDLLQTKQLLAKTQQLQLQNQELLLVDTLNRQNKLQTDLSLTLLNTEQKDIRDKTQLLLQNELNTQTRLSLTNKLQLLKSEILTLEKPLTLIESQPVERLQLHFTNGDIMGIIDDLVEEGIISDKTRLSFTLNYNELVVDGRKQNSGLHDKLKEKYGIKGRGDHFIYKTDGHSTSTDINKE